MASRRASRGSSHKPVRNHEEARLSCCAACGKGGAQLAVTPALQELIKRFAHPCYSVEVQSFPVGLCKYCKTCLYQCRSKGAAPREEWAAFKPEEVHIPRVPPGTDCQCAMCHTARFNPVGIKGEKKVVTSPVINTSGGPMECEVQERSVRKGQGVCEICLQITGRGIRHKCTAKERKERQAGRGRSSHRLAANRRKRNLSVLVGREAESAQEQITSDALQRIRGIKGSNSFSMKSMSGGGIGGMGPEVKIGGGEEEQKVIGLELFTEVKKHLVKSKNKMERLCRIMRKHGVKMEPRVKEKLSLQDHKLDEHYETIKVEMTKTVTEEVPIDPNEKRRGRKSAKTTRKVKKEVTEEKDLTILKKPKEFLEKLAEDRFIWKGDVVHRISMDGGDNSFKIICNSFSKHGDPEITFTRTEEPGNLCSGVNRSIILAFVEGVQENHENLRVILELLQLDTLGFVVAADLKLLNVMLGLSGHGGKFACYICEGEIGLQPGVLRTISSLITHSKAYEDNGSKPATMQSFKNCVKPPLLDADEDALVMHLVPPPELHLLMGACNKGLEVLREALEKVGLEEKLWTWCSKHGVTRRGELTCLMNLVTNKT